MFFRQLVAGMIGYTLSHVRDERGRSSGVALFFKDLTKVGRLTAIAGA